MREAPTKERIGKWLQEARERQDRYSQEQVAPLVGATTRTVGGWERGETAPPVDKFFAMALLYGADVQTLLSPKAKGLSPGLKELGDSPPSARGKAKDRAG